MKIYLNIHTLRLVKILIFLPLMNMNINPLYAEDSHLKDMEIGSSTKSIGNSSDFPTNPFEIVEMIRKANSMNDATKPSDAIDDALNSFNEIQDKENL